MDRGYGSGFSSWGGGGGGGGSGSRGSGGFDMYGGGYKDGFGRYGGGGGSPMKRGPSGQSLSSSVAHADDVIAKINQRLDMLTRLEGGLKGARGDRFDQYESFDSRSSALSSRDLYRSGDSSYGYGDDRGDNMLLGQRGGSGFGGGMGFGGGGGGFGSPTSSYGVAKMRQNVRESFTSSQGGGSGGGGGGWAGAGRHSPRRGGSAGGRGGFGRRRPDPAPLGGVMRGGHTPRGGRGKLPSLLSNRRYPESGGPQGLSQGPHDFPGRHFGGGQWAGRQRGRKRALNKQTKPQRDNQKKRKQTLSGSDEPEPKINKTERSDSESAQGTSQEQGEPNGEGNPPKTDIVEAGTEENKDKASPKQDEKKKTQGKQNQYQYQDRPIKMKKRRGFLEKVMFACSMCKFRSFYKEEMETHLESRFHKDHYKFLSGQLSKPTTDFLQEYLLNKFKKTEQKVSQLQNHSDVICQIYKEQDLTKDIGMEHFMKKVEAAHCGACDLFIPMQPFLIQKHLKSADHNFNRKGMMETSKRGSLSVARSILNHKLIGKKLESYLKGENPFTGNQDELDDSVAMEIAAATADDQIDGAPAKEEMDPEEETIEKGEGDVEEETIEKGEGDVEEETIEKGEGDVEGGGVEEGEGDVEGGGVEEGEGDVEGGGVEEGEGDVEGGGVEEESAAADTVAEEKMEEEKDDILKGEEEPEQQHLEDEEGFDVEEEDEGFMVQDEVVDEDEDEQEGLQVELEEEEENGENQE